MLNTDAEGRLILADALTLAADTKPDAIIDLATLTGACMVALGTQVAGLFANDQALADRLLAVSAETGEPLWQLPLVAEYKDDIKSAVADLKNIGGGHAGSITAALFLQEFVGTTPWVHLDIAGPAFLEKGLPYAPKGGTGFGVRTLLALPGRRSRAVARGARAAPTALRASNAPAARRRRFAAAAVFACRARLRRGAALLLRGRHRCARHAALGGAELGLAQSAPMRARAVCTVGLSPRR